MIFKREVFQDNREEFISHQHNTTALTLCWRHYHLCLWHHMLAEHPQSEALPGRRAPSLEQRAHTGTRPAATLWLVGRVPLGLWEAPARAWVVPALKYCKHMVKIAPEQRELKLLFF